MLSNVIMHRQAPEEKARGITINATHGKCRAKEKLAAPVIGNHGRCDLGEKLCGG